MFSAVDVFHIVVVVDEQRGGIRSVKHPVFRTLLREEKNKNKMKRVNSAHSTALDENLELLSIKMIHSNRTETVTVKVPADYNVSITYN